jgi:hypothetical protein
MIPKWQHIQITVELDEIEKRLNVLSPENPIESEEITRHLLRLEHLSFMLTKKPKTKLRLIKNE